MGALVPMGPNNERKKFLATWLEILWETTLTKAEEKLTAEKIKAYEIALASVPDRLLAIGLKRCVEECKFFPLAEEIRERAVLPKDEQEAAYEEFTQRVLEAAKTQKLLPSVLDGEVQHKTMPRSERIAKGIEEPAPVDVVARINELKRQALFLGASDWRRDTAGAGAGLV